MHISFHLHKSKFELQKDNVYVYMEYTKGLLYATFLPHMCNDTLEYWLPGIYLVLHEGSFFPS